MSNDVNAHSSMTQNTIFGFWLYLMTDCIMFATFFATYAVLNSNMHGTMSPKDLFDLRFTLGETLVLLSSSFTCGIAMLFAPRKNRLATFFWFAVTFLLGIIFLYMQKVEFDSLFARGLDWKSSGYMSSYFTLIGVHSLHIIAGLFMMPIFLYQLYLSNFTEVVLRRLTCLRMYWHFLYLIWIFTFSVVYLIGSK